MPDQTPGPGRDDEQAAASATGQPGFAGAPGSPGSLGTGPVPPTALDWQALLEALAAGGFLDRTEEDQEVAAAAEGRMSTPLSPGQAGALAVEHMPPGPAQAGWLAAATGEATSLDEYGLAGVAIAARQLASWATAAELNAVAQLTARTADADAEIGLAADGRPARVCRDAVGQISLALSLTDHSATAWADLAVTLCWRLPATGAALAAGRIDLARVKVIAEATSVLSEGAARAVEAQILPDAGQQTTAQLRVRLRRVVIAVDPEAAERRRQEAERQARVSLYADEDGTATLAGTGLPAVEAAAAMARISAIARAMKAAGQAGGLDLHRARVMLGLLLGTLPYIPPPAGTRSPNPATAAAPAAAALVTAPPRATSGRQMTRRPPVTKTPRPTTASMTTPMTASTKETRTTIAGPGPGRHRRGQAWARYRSPWPAPGLWTGGRHRGCWMSRCHGPPWPGCPPRPGCWAASAP